MIGPTSMVVLKGHYRFPMVVLSMTYHGLTHMFPVPPGTERPPFNAARVVWLGKNGEPYEAVYPLEILEEVDGPN